VVLLTGYATPDGIRRIGQTRLTGWLRNRNVRGSADVAARAIHAAKAQTVVQPGQDLSASIITELATAILALDDRLKALDAQIEATFAEHPQAAIIQSMPGFGPFLGTSPPQPDLCPSQTTPAGGPATCTAPCATAARYGTCSTSRLRPA
jgi:hypothetical protein